MPTKHCFMNKERVCDLTCKAAFPVEDPVDPVDCYFIWLAANVGEGLFDLRRGMEANKGFPAFGSGPSSSGGPGQGTEGGPGPPGTPLSNN